VQGRERSHYHITITFNPAPSVPGTCAVVRVRVRWCVCAWCVCVITHSLAGSRLVHGFGCAQ
jgi:hypothetical protein